MQKHLTISENLDKKFRATIRKKRQLKKGIIQECVEEAITDWIRKGEGDDLVGYV